MTIKDLAFSVAEYEDRLARVRKEMETQELDALLCMTPEDLYWLTGYRSMGFFAFQVLVVTHDKEPVMISRKLEEMIFFNNAWCNTYRAYYDYEDPVVFTVDVLQDLGLNKAGKRFGVPMNSEDLSALSMKNLEKLLPNTKFVDTTMLVTKMRWIKSSAELEYMMKAAEFTRMAVYAATDVAKEGATENDIAAAYLYTLYKNGSEISSGGPLIAAGPRSAFGHASWENRRLEKGDLIFCEGGGCVRRYHAGIMRTISVGVPSDFAKRLAEASRAGANAAVTALKPGATSGEVDEACRDAVHELGMGEYFRHRTGYTIGMGFRSWAEGMSLRPNDPSVIEENMTFHIVPFLSTGETSVALSETVVVKPKGGERMVDLESKIFFKE